MVSLTPVIERVKKALFCKHIFDSIPSKTPTVLLLTCRECELEITANVESYKLNTEEMIK